MARKIVVTSGKGGVGKTTLVVNLGYALSKLDKKVLVVDMDFGLNNLDVVLGVENKIVYDIFDCLEGKCRASQAIIEHFDCPNLHILPTNRTFCPRVDDNSIKIILDEIEDSYDFILIDCPAGIDNSFSRAVNLANEAIIVTTPHISSVRDADKVQTLLDNYSISPIWLVVNRARGDMMLNGEMININTIAEYLSLNLLGVVPEDDCISVQLLSGGMVGQNNQAYIAYSMIANRLLFGSSEIYDCTAKYKGLIGGIRKKLKKYI